MRSPTCPPLTCMHLIPHVVVVTPSKIAVRRLGNENGKETAANKEFNYEKRRNLRPKHGKKSRTDPKSSIWVDRGRIFTLSDSILDSLSCEFFLENRA